MDIGSGKGYLGQYITRQYGLDVIGIDSSDSNTHGARERNHKLLNKWEGLSKHSMNIQQSHVQSENQRETFKEMYIKRAHKMKKRQTFVKPADEVTQASLDPVLLSNGVMNMQHGGSQSEDLEVPASSKLEDNGASCLHNHQSKRLLDECNRKDMNMQHPDSQSSGSSFEIRDTHCEDGIINDFQNINIYSDEDNKDTSSKKGKTIICSSNCTLPNISTKSQETNADIEQSIDSNCDCDQNINLTHNNKRHEQNKSTLSGASFCPVTAFVELDTSLTSMVSKKSEELRQHLHTENEVVSSSTTTSRDIGNNVEYNHHFSIQI